MNQLQIAEHVLIVSPTVLLVLLLVQVVQVVKQDIILFRALVKVAQLPARLVVHLPRLVHHVLKEDTRMETAAQLVLIIAPLARHRVMFVSHVLQAIIKLVQLVHNAIQHAQHVAVEIWKINV